VFENGVLRKIFGPKKVKWEEDGETCIIMSFTTLH
jgi:hypothetical protein